MEREQFGLEAATPSEADKQHNESLIQIPLDEAIQLCAVDGVFFSHYFFPKTVRQVSPQFHYEVWDGLDNPYWRYISEQIFRGGAKTTIARLYAARRISLALTHTILYIGKSEGHALRSVGWLMRQVERNRRWSQAFKLSRGSKWQPTECEIWHGVENRPVWIVATGIEGAVRGINIDDYRPDTIILDDVLSDENAATEEQRQKIDDLIHGAVKESLSPRSEDPYAKMAMLNTPLNKDDATQRAMTDPEWLTLRFGCFTKETEDLDLDSQESIWKERWPSEEVRKAKRAAIQKNRLSTWLREKECKLIDPETCAMKSHWLKHWDWEARGDIAMLPREGRRTLIIDPVPPPSEIQIAKGLHGKDYEVLMVVQRTGGKFFCCEYAMNKGHNPNWTIAKFFELAIKWKIHKYHAEAVAYQRTLKWLLEEAMKFRGIYFPYHELKGDKRSKYDKIVDPLTGPASYGQVYVHHTQQELISQFNAYPNVTHDDVLECLAKGIEILSDGEYIATEGLGEDEGQEPLPLQVWGAP